ncbi:hypothetical protein PLEOSDRAFT_1098607 [Pleurotus ostreatus PC15]|uniref:Fe2OG dioxygenase domain-containing protein n=1 Tax=Pleurotus ostreatus (strain PC15) TaxID=1137138 RepID=A0A067NX10_PLEO1|nr:hypothetical protein PLEOSDRAFT_1098607 [Pleurotus ostreatus PC15]
MCSLSPTGAASPDQLDPWVFPPDTNAIPEDQYVDLEVLDLSAFNVPDELVPGRASNTLLESHKELITRAFEAFRTVGFVAIKGHGLSHDDIRHQFNIGKLLNYGVSEEEKRRLHAQIWEGSWAGYKPQGYYNRPDGAFDYVEHYDLYPWTALRSRMPNIGQPLLKDIRQFIEHNHFVILRKILAILSLGLGLEIDTLWKIHHRGGVLDKGLLIDAPADHVKWQHTKDHLRYAMYHPPTEEDRIKRKYLWVPGHTDLGSVTFLYSQPIAGLQILTAPDEWRYVRHYPDHIIVDLGDSIEFLTGGILKASPHRVIEPPEDQRHLDRLGIFYFVPFLGDTVLKPIDHPSIHKFGIKDFFEEYYALGGKPITAEGAPPLRPSHYP